MCICPNCKALYNEYVQKYLLADKNLIKYALINEKRKEDDIKKQGCSISTYEDTMRLHKLISEVQETEAAMLSFSASKSVEVCYHQQGIKPIG